MNAEHYPDCWQSGAEHWGCAVKEVERLKDRPRWWHCPTHGGQDGRVEWGCPECIKELRQQFANCQSSHELITNEKRDLAKTVEILRQQLAERDAQLAGL